MMKTSVIIKREFGKASISQRTGDKYFNATELLQTYVQSSGKKRVMADFWQNKGTLAFMDALCKDISETEKTECIEVDLYTTTRGTNGGTYMHPYLFVKFAMWLSPEFEVQIIKWVYDNLIDFRNQAGDHYNEMCQAIQDRYLEYYKGKPDPLVFIKEANYLNTLVFGQPNGKKRNDATEEELSTLNKLQLVNIKLINQGLSLAIRKEKLRDFLLLYR